MARPRVVIQDLSNIRLASLYSEADSNPIPRWRGDSRGDGPVISSDGAACLLSALLAGSLIQGYAHDQNSGRVRFRGVT